MSKGFLRKIFLSAAVLFLSYSFVSAEETPDFSFSNYTDISYSTGDDYVTVKTTYIRDVNNSDYYYPATGEKVFLIPDISTDTDEDISTERQFKLSSLTVTDNGGNKLEYSSEEQDDGIYVSVPNYKATTYKSALTIVVTYNTHDLVTKVFDTVKIIAPALPTDVEFSYYDKNNGTTSKYNYYLSITVDKDTPEFIRAFPSQYTSEETEDGGTKYSFTQDSRVGKSPVLEFGTSLIYKFTYTYTTPKTDDIINPDLSKYFSALSTNIYKLSLPREYSETNQKVYIESISPSPSKISLDDDGNIIGTFEVPANKESEIKVTGYISVSRQQYKDDEVFTDINLSSYFDTVKADSSLSKYLTATTYWEVNDEYIVSEATSVMSQDGIHTIMDLIEADYNYVNEKLEYDQSKASSGNVRIGAKAALQGGASVCMEYSDAMITILRAQGIPARAAVGYASLTADADNSTNILRHQWVQVWIQEYGWLTIDPTYEGSDKIIGPYIDRILWETFSGDSLSNIKIYSADAEKIVDDPTYTVSVYAVESMPSEDNLHEYVELNHDKTVESTDEDNSVFQWFNTFLKTTVIGKAVIIIMPIAGVIVILSILLSTLSYFIKKNKVKHTKQKDQQAF